MADASSESRLYLPFLRPFYAAAAPFAWPIVRLAIGWNLAVHGWGKLMAGPAAVTPGFVDLGFHEPYGLIILLTVVEFGGGVCIALGLFTRFFAAAVAIEMAYITFGIYWPTGFSWLKRGYEYTLMWGLVSFAIALRGGGAWSLDRLLKREL